MPFTGLTKQRLSGSSRFSGKIRIEVFEHLRKSYPQTEHMWRTDTDHLTARLIQLDAHTTSFTRLVIKLNQETRMLV